MADDKKDDCPVVDVIKIESDGCLHCAFSEFAETMILHGGHDPQRVIYNMAGALADMIAGLIDKEDRERVLFETSVTLPVLVDQFVAERDAEEKACEAMDFEKASFHKPGNA